MNYFINIVKSLNGKEKISLLRKINSQRLKLKLFNYVLENNEIDNISINTHLSYEKNSNSLYTLKNRLLDDIMTVKQEFVRNEVIKVKEDVQCLTSLLMNGDKDLLIRELKKLEKAANRFDLYPELKIINYCYFLINNRNSKKQANYLKLIEGLNKKIEISFEVEKLFYNKLIQAQELFYYPNKKLLDEFRYDREKLNHYSNMLQNHTARFFLLYTDTIVSLISPSAAELGTAYKNLQNLSKLYEYSFIKRTLPVAQKTIECLYLRYYYLANNNTQFGILQRSIYPDILRLHNHFIFGGSFFLFTNQTILDYLKHGKPDQVVTFISKIIKEGRINLASTSINAHTYYLMAIKEYYLQNFSASSSLLIKARNSVIPNTAAWLLIEITLLNLMNMLQQQEFLYIEHEISLLRRYFLKYKIEETHVKAFNNLFRAAREYEKSIDNARIIGAIAHIQNDTGLMKLILTVQTPVPIYA